MPKVGDRHFSYDRAGREQAKAYAKRTGRKVTNKRAKRQTSRNR